MPEQEFGGNWTQEKLARISKYLPAYTTIFHGNERAQYFQTVYVDAFAGTGYVSLPKRKGRKGESEGNYEGSIFSEEESFFAEIAEPETQEFLKGSAQIALDVEPPFDHYLFIEKKLSHAAELQRLRNQNHEIAHKIEIVQGDANAILNDWCKKQNWKTQRAVVFLDPYGMGVEWSMLETLAQTKAIDLWLLWPIGQAINRLLTKNELPPEAWCNRLTQAFGTDEWRSRFYPAWNLFAEAGESIDLPNTKSATFSEIEKFFMERLKTLFEFVAPNPLYLYNSQNTPLYLLCFASHNRTALKIATHILGK